MVKVTNSRLTIQMLRRLPKYLQYLKSLPSEQNITISATTIARAMDLNDVQVRKDLASISNNGKPKVGYEREVLINDLQNALGWSNNDDAVLVGTGKLGKTLMDYEGLKNYGLNIVAGFDNDPTVWERSTNRSIFPMEKMEDLVSRMGIRIGIITVPASCAQDVCDKLVNCGVKAIWNFSPTHLNVPDGVLVHSENLASSIALLMNHMNQVDQQ